MIYISRRQGALSNHGSEDFGLLTGRINSLVAIDGFNEDVNCHNLPSALAMTAFT